MELRAELGQGCRPAAEVLRHRPGLQGPQPQPELRRGGGEPLHEVDEPLAIFEVLAPGGDLDARQHYLPVALVLEPFRLLPGLGEGQGPHRSPGVGNDAVGAEVDAAVLHL